jgi:hypothetical protein
VKRREGRRRKLLMDRGKERILEIKKKEIIDHTVWRTRCGRGCGPVVRQTAELMIHREPAESPYV